MTRPALYYYASSKEDLLSKCYDWSFSNFRDRIAGAVNAGTGCEKLIQFFLVYADVVCNDVSRCFLSSETHHLSAGNDRQTREGVRSINRQVADLLDEGMRDGSIAPCDPKYALTMLFGAFNQLPRLVRRSGPSPVKLGAELIDLVLKRLAPR